MKKIILLLVLLGGFSFAENNNAFGLWLGNYGGGIDYKHLEAKNAYAVYLNGLHIGGSKTELGISGGYYWVFPNIIKADASAGSFPLYWGPNVGFGYWRGGENPWKYRGFDIGANIVGGVSWFLPTPFRMDLSFELLSPNLGIWNEEREQGPGGGWKDNPDNGLGIRNYLGIRLLFHAYFF